ncbi:MAG: ClpX C4-type zinc finger protein [Alcanivoracaceae bacterium]|nr:ClpX C4-type zinc finger protein [Alcanivoracaceae bacterium]
MDDKKDYEKVAADNEETCSFCGKKRSEVKAIFRNENARICDQCISKMKQDAAKE